MVSLKAVPGPGYHFDHWEGAVWGRDPVTQFKIVSDTVVITARESFGPKEGGSVSDTSLLQVDIPPEAFSDETTIVIGRILNPTSFPDTLRAVGSCHYLGPEGMSFDTGVLVRISRTLSFGAVIILNRLQHR